MLDRWDDLSVLLAVSRGGSLAAAAQTLGVDPSTVSRRLRALEQALDARLFDRTPDGLRPTDLARRLRPHAEQAEAAVIAAQAEVAGVDARLAGSVRVAVAGGVAVYGLAPRLPELLARYPDIEVEMLVDVAIADLSRREADIALRFERPESPDLVARRLGSTGPYKAWAHRDYLARREPGEPLRWIGWLPEYEHLPEARFLLQVAGGRPRVRSSELVSMIEAMRAGAGVMLLPGALGEWFPGVVPVEEVEVPPMEIDLWLVLHRALRTVPRVRVVVDWMVETVGRMSAGPVLRPG